MISFKIEGDLSQGFDYLERQALRRAVAQRIRNEIQERVQRRGEGAGGRVKGYSTGPMLLKAENAGRMKPIILPSTQREHAGKTKRTATRDATGAKWVFYRGGTEQYKRETGQVFDRFTLTNKGALWRDWRVLGVVVAADGVVDAGIGFSRKENADAAGKAEADGRPDLLDVGSAEVERAEQEALDFIMKTIARTASL